MEVFVDHPAVVLGAHLLHAHAAQQDPRASVQASEAQLGEGVAPDARGLEPAADLVLVEGVW